MNDPVALLERMLQIPSLSGQEQELAHFLVAEMAGLGFESFIDPAGNAVGIAGQGPDMVLLGHIDTVPGDIAVRRDQGLLYGRGAVDAKGPFATFVAAVARRIAAGDLQQRLILIGAVEEEAASSKGAHYVRTQYQPQACIIGEPSGWERLTLGYKGRLLIDGFWEQAGAHSAGPGQAVAEQAVAFWNAVQRYCEQFNSGKTRLFDQLLPSLRSINSRSDGLYDQATLTIGLRLPPALAPADLTTDLQHLNAGQAFPGALQFRDGCPAYRGEKNSALVRAFLRGIRTAGGRPGFLLKTGTSDMNVVGPAWNCPILAYGPGDSELDHTPDEHITIAEYLRAIDVLAAALADL
jgi:[amino group carrier protein]-lysine/ornithine hydrolase